MKTDYEVEGCWTASKNKTKCRACGTLLIPVPKEGHFNSKYLELEKNDNMHLVCCPNNCSVEKAEKEMKKDSKTPDSKNLDYTNISNAWINRKGKIYPCGFMKHIDLAFELNSDELDLEKKGWLKLSCSDFMWERKLSKKQIDFVFDYLVSNKREQETEKFMKQSKHTIGYFKRQ